MERVKSRPSAAGRGSRAAKAEIVPDNFLHDIRPWLPDGIFCES